MGATRLFVIVRLFLVNIIGYCGQYVQRNPLAVLWLIQGICVVNFGCPKNLRAAASWVWFWYVIKGSCSVRLHPLVWQWVLKSAIFHF